MPFSPMENEIITAPITVMVRVNLAQDISISIDTCFTSFTVLVTRVELRSPGLLRPIDDSFKQIAP